MTDFHDQRLKLLPRPHQNPAQLIGGNVINAPPPNQGNRAHTSCPDQHVCSQDAGLPGICAKRGTEKAGGRTGWPFWGPGEAGLRDVGPAVLQITYAKERPLSDGGPRAPREVGALAYP